MQWTKSCRAALAAFGILMAGVEVASAGSSAAEFKADLMEAFEAGSDAAVLRKSAAALRRGVVRDPNRVLAFTRLAMKGAFRLHRDRELGPASVERFMVSVTKGYYERRPRFDRKLEESLEAIFKTVPGGMQFDETYVQRLYRRLLPLQIAAGEDPEHIRLFFEKGTGIVCD